MLIRRLGALLKGSTLCWYEQGTGFSLQQCKTEWLRLTEMDQSVKFSLGSHENQSPISSTDLKKPGTVALPFIFLLRSWGQWIPGTFWPPSLAKSVSPRLNERPFLKRKKGHQNTTTTEIWMAPLVWTWYPGLELTFSLHKWAHICIHTYTDTWTQA